MATTLYCRNTATSGIGSFFDLDTSAGSSSVNAVVNTAASGTNIQWTASAGGSVIEWISGRAPSGGFTLSGTVSIKLNANESNSLANAGGRLRLYKRTSAGVETELSGSPSDKGTEFGTTLAAVTWTFTPSSGMSFAEDDRLVVRFFITAAGGTMGGSRTCTMRYNNSSANTGDTNIALTETVAFKANAVIYQLSTVNKNANVTISGADSLTASSGTGGGGALQSGIATFSLPAGKWFIEAEFHTFQSGENIALGLANSSMVFTDGHYLGESGSNSIGKWDSNNVYFNNAIIGATDTVAAGGIVGMAMDTNPGVMKAWFRVDAGGFESGDDPVAGTGGFAIGVTGPLFPAYTVVNGTTRGVIIFNFGATAFAHTPPTGYVGPAASSGISGAASITEASDTVSATGTLAIAGTASITEASDTTSATGTLAITGSASITEADDTMTATGQPAAFGSASITEDSDSLAATGTLDLKASAAITEASDTTSATGTLAIVGSASITEASDTLSSTGSLAIAGASSITEADDALSSTATLAIAASASITEADDQVAATAALAISGQANITEDDDTIASSNSSDITGTASITEQSDTLAASGALSITGSASITEDDDTSAAGAVIPIAGAATIVEDDDAVVSIGVLALAGAALLAEDDDTIEATATLGPSPIAGEATIIEADDLIVSVGKLTIVGIASITEDDDTTQSSATIAQRFFEEDLRDKLLSDPGLSALIGDRASWAMVPQAAARPLIALWNEGRQQGDTFKGRENLKRGIVKIDCRGTTVREAVRVRRAARLAIDGFRGQVGSTIFQGVFVDNAAVFDDVTSRDPSISDYQATLDVEVWFTGAA